MSWLVGYALASLVGAFLVVRMAESLFAGLVGGIGHAARATLFVATGAAIAAVSGRRAFTQRVRRLRQVIGR